MSAARIRPKQVAAVARRPQILARSSIFLLRLPSRGRLRPLPAVRSARIVSAIVRSSHIIAVAIVAGFLAAANAFAHGDVHGQIIELTAQLAQTPSNATLYFRRADLYRVDQDYTNALADLNRAAQFDPSLVRVDFCRGRVHFEAGRPEAALVLLNKYLAAKPEDSEAFATRARVLRKLNEFKRAADDYTTAIRMTRVSNPELYIERAEALRALGKSDEALRGLDEGIRLMGPLVTLELPAIDLEISLKRHDAALARIDTVSARLQRKESWLLRRAEILQQAGRTDEARQNCRDALAAIERLPPTHRGTRATVELAERIRTTLASLSPAPSRK